MANNPQDHSHGEPADMEKLANQLHGKAHDDHGGNHDHGHGHGDDPGEIIPEKSPEDFMLTMLLSSGALLGFITVCYFMVTGFELKHLEPNAGPSMYVYTGEPAHAEGEEAAEGHHHHHHHGAEVAEPSGEAGHDAHGDGEAGHDAHGDGEAGHESHADAGQGHTDGASHAESEPAAH